MDASRINAKIYTGRGKAALRLGFDYVVYRPSEASNPLTHNVRIIKAVFNRGDNSYLNPNLPKNAFWNVDVDGNYLQVGDYLVGDSQVFFIAGMQSILPIVAVECNRRIRISAHNPQTGTSGATVGAVGYNGLCNSTDESVDTAGINPANNNGLFVGWPCSILFGGQSSKNSHAMPSGSDKQQGFTILLPASLPTILNAGDLMFDDLGRRYVVHGAQQTDFGWAINANEVHI